MPSDDNRILVTWIHYYWSTVTSHFVNYIIDSLEKNFLDEQSPIMVMLIGHPDHMIWQRWTIFFRVMRRIRCIKVILNRFLILWMEFNMSLVRKSINYLKMRLVKQWHEISIVLNWNMLFWRLDDTTCHTPLEIIQLYLQTFSSRSHCRLGNQNGHFFHK